MADPFPSAVIVELPLRRCDDAELTCFVCMRAWCDYETVHRGHGRFAVIGAHLECVKALRAPNEEQLRTKDEDV